MSKSSFFLAIFLLLPLNAARAETRIFLLDNFDGYGVDRCLMLGEPCGEKLATAWCRAHSYANALDYGRTPPSSSATPVARADTPRETCTGPLCPAMVAITCTR